MTTMNISLPEALKAFVDEQVAGRGYGTSSEYVRELIRRDQDRLQLRNLLSGVCCTGSVMSRLGCRNRASREDPHHALKGFLRGRHLRGP